MSASATQGRDLLRAADDEREEIVRALHHGPQGRLVGLALEARQLAGEAPEGSGLAARLEGVAAGLDAVNDELRALARAIMPPVLVDRGLARALVELARDAPIPVEVDIAAAPRERPDRDVERAAYFATAGALAAVAAAGRPPEAAVLRIAACGDELRVSLRHRGAASANATDRIAGAHRVEALGGSIATSRPEPGVYETVLVLPLRPP